MRAHDTSIPRPPASTSPPELPADRAFVVQFRVADPWPRAAGRVEHVVSGETARFDSWQELRAFVEGVLASGRRP
jgi:hypothetical protein